MPGNLVCPAPMGCCGQAVISGPGSTTLTYNANQSSWTTGCVSQQTYQLLCNSGQIEFRVTFFVSGNCPTGQKNFCSNLRVAPFGLVLASFTCSPFSMTFTLPDPICPAVEAPGYTSFTITDPNP